MREAPSQGFGHRLSDFVLRVKAMIYRLHFGLWSLITKHVKTPTNETMYTVPQAKAPLPAA